MAKTACMHIMLSCCNIPKHLSGKTRTSLGSNVRFYISATKVCEQRFIAIFFTL